MKITPIGEPRVIMSNDTSIHNYFAWPTATRLKNGKIAVVASGFRISHICPFGKTVISYSEDEGETYTAPAPVIDTPLDDRDGGILAFGECGVIVTSFNNTVEMQKTEMTNKYNLTCATEEGKKALNGDYRLAYLNTISKETEEKYLGSSFRVSTDNGVTFGPIRKSPITSPHGPLETRNGRIIWVGRTFAGDEKHENVPDKLIVIEIDPYNDRMRYLGEIPPIVIDGETILSCEPHAIEISDGTLICHIRAQKSGKYFTIYQSESYDGGRTWSTPMKLLDDLGGAPSHILKCKDGTLIATYAYRTAPYGIRAMVSDDEGETWQIDLDICENGVSFDIGYPSTVELADGTFITVFYAHTEEGEPARVLQQKWKLEKQ